MTIASTWTHGRLELLSALDTKQSCSRHAQPKSLISAKQLCNRPKSHDGHQSNAQTTPKRQQGSKWFKVVRDALVRDIAFKTIN
jgi:hypothetical protein